MRDLAARLICASLAALVAGCASDGPPNSAQPGSSEALAKPSLPRVTNFMLVDHNLEAHELFRMADARAIVIVTTANGCPISRAMQPGLKALKAAYAGKGVEFLMLNSALQDSRAEIQAEAREYDSGIPILMDRQQLVGEELGVTRTAEVYVIDPRTWQVVYRGPLDDRIDYGGAQKAAAIPFAALALDALLEGRAVSQPQLPGKGCLIDFPERRDHARISYARDVAPILEKNCVTCHQDGGIGPFAMSGYEMVKGFSPMIREVLRTDRMPPYNADPHVGPLADDRNLTPAEVKTLVHWIEAGAPRGDGPDPLAQKRRTASEWPLGPPDMVLDVPAFTIPASGEVDYQRPLARNPLTEGRWIRATTVKPGQRQGVHHVLSGWVPSVPANGQTSETQWQNSVGDYAVGAESTIRPPNVGTYLPPGGAVGFQMHYTPFGKEVVDQTKLGIYFYKDPPGLVMRNLVILDTSISIPAGAPRHREVAYAEFPRNAVLYAAFPHAHYRAYATELWIRYPGGKETLLLALPRYDFNWQRDYTFASPIMIPAGSRVIARYTYDNSPRNPANPDPTKVVTWGEQSHEEMLFTALRFRWADETSTHPVSLDGEMNRRRLIGMLDDDIDGRVQRAELKGRPGAALASRFDQIDRNKDGALDNAELAAVQGLVGGRRR